MKTLLIRKVTADVKNGVKDCLMNLLYRKQDLLDFFKSSNLTQSDLRDVDVNDTKSRMIDVMFLNLSKRSDNGATQFKSVIENIVDWTDFGSHWFQNGSLDPKEAKTSIERLKKILGEKTEKDLEIQEIKERQLRLKKQQDKKLAFQSLNNDFVELCKMAEHTQKRGYKLEKLLVALFDYFDIEVYKSFKLLGEQIDGSFKFDGQNYTFEAKWQDQVSAVNSLYAFTMKIETNNLYPRGIFLSINGYSSEAVEIITKNKKPNLLLFDSLDLIAVLEERISLSDLLHHKIRYAQSKGGNIYINASKLLEGKMYE
ncbi:MAG: hypothetical protein NUV65_03495 [Candidatus Roizmanbacteria bacterium]|nr:hypothetical protein [Candidatus Roizmanbacteria bacterium]